MHTRKHNIKKKTRNYLVTHVYMTRDENAAASFVCIYLYYMHRTCFYWRVARDTKHTRAFVLYIYREREEAHGGEVGSHTRRDVDHDDLHIVNFWVLYMYI